MIADIEDALLRFWEALDQGDFGGMLACVSGDCIWQRGSEVVTGRNEIVAVLKTRPAKRCSRHLVNNIRITEEGGEFVATYVLLAFVHDVKEGEAAPYPIVGPMLIANMITRGRCDSGPVLISHVQAEPLFTSFIK